MRVFAAGLKVCIYLITEPSRAVGEWFRVLFWELGVLWMKSRLPQQVADNKVPLFCLSK